MIITRCISNLYRVGSFYDAVCVEIRILEEFLVVKAEFYHTTANKSTT